MHVTRRIGSLSDSDVDALLAGRPLPVHPALEDALALLRAAACAPAPPPSAALAAVLAAGFVPRPTAAAVLPPSLRWRRRAAYVVLVAVTGLTATAGAAAADVLPDPVQSVVADAVEALTPLYVPRPDGPSRGSDGLPGSGSPADGGISTTRSLTGGQDERQASEAQSPQPEQRPVAAPTRQDVSTPPVEAPDQDATDADDLGTEQPGTHQPDSAPAGDEPAADEPATDRPDSTPGAGEPEIIEPDADVPDGDGSGADDAGTREPEQAEIG